MGVNREAGMSKAWAMTMLAVLWPLAVTRDSPSQDECLASSTMISAIFLRFLDLVEQANLLDARLNCSTSNDAISWTCENKAGVTSFTFLSVVWADSITATRSV